jgi:hypothetical protein
MKLSKFEQQKYDEMRRSLCIEFRYAKKPSIHKILTEAKGMVEGSDEIIDVIMNKIQQETQNGLNEMQVKVTTQDFSNLQIQPFFEEILVLIDYKKEPKEGIKGVYSDKYNELTDDNSKLKAVVITFIMHGDYKQLIYQLQPLIAHELLHAYENFQRIKKTGKNMQTASEELNYANNQRVLQIAKTTNNDIIQQLSYTLYYCISFEKNAYTTQLKQQMKNLRNNITNADDAMQTLQYTQIYQGYITIGQNLNYIIANKDKYKEDIEEWYNLVYNKNLSYGKILRRLRNLYNKTWNKMRKSIASYIKSLYENNSVTCTYDNFSFTPKSIL